MAIISDNALDYELAEMRKVLDRLRQMQTVFSNTFKTISAHDRAKLLRRIETDQKMLSGFLDRVKGLDVNNYGLKFALDNFRGSYFTLQSLWRRTEKMLETLTSVPGTVSSAKPIDSVLGPPVGESQSGGIETNIETDRAVQAYSSALKNLGQIPSLNQVEQFRQQLDSAYKSAQQKAGARDLSIEVVQEDGKIKVKMRPKN